MLQPLMQPIVQSPTQSYIAAQDIQQSDVEKFLFKKDQVSIKLINDQAKVFYETLGYSNYPQAGNSKCRNNVEWAIPRVNIDVISHMPHVNQVDYIDLDSVLPNI